MTHIIRSGLPIVLFLITGSFSFAADEKPTAPPTSIDKTAPQPGATQPKKSSSADIEKKPDKLIEAAATAARIVSGMKTAEEKITRKETGDDTRKVQKQVIDDLQSLIDAASRMQQQQQKQQQQRQQQKSAQQDSEQQKEQQQNQADSGQGGNTRRKDDKGRDSTEAVGESAKKDAAADRQRKLLGEVWGHLPESLRQRLLNDLGEKTLPGYDDLVRRYFEALAEPPKTGSKSSEKKIK